MRCNPLPSKLRGVSKGFEAAFFLDSSNRLWQHSAPKHQPVTAVHEIKFDGYRAQLHERDAGTKMFTRRGYNRSDRFRHRLFAQRSCRTKSGPTAKITTPIMEPPPQGDLFGGFSRVAQGLTSYVWRVRIRLRTLPF